ncbi:hypothetical protein [Pseudomonas sp. 02C 26]|nr:hypothetical protein [Pseudomonas sp. 02C 26]
MGAQQLLQRLLEAGGESEVLDFKDVKNGYDSPNSVKTYKS